jgi:hypothetical protein
MKRLNQALGFGSMDSEIFSIGLTFGEALKHKL